MRLTKHGHSCVRVEHDGVRLVIDPGVFTAREAVADASAILVTHVHPDHVDVGHLQAVDAPIWTIAEVAEEVLATVPSLAERITVLEPGAELDLGLRVRTVGELHAVIHPELPRFHNSGYLVEAGSTTLFHPGDSLTLPGVAVDVACIPVSAPWLKVSEAIDFARDLGAPVNLAIHDEIYSEAGLGIVDGHLRRFLEPGGRYERLTPGTDLDL